MNAPRLHLAILRGASWLVPVSLRTEWLVEWTSELWYVRRASTRQRAACFCLGAFRDAFWLRRNTPGPKARALFHLESPQQCALFLVALAAVSTFLAFRMPTSRNLIPHSPYPDAHRLAMIFAGKQAGAPTISLDQYRSLSNHGRRLFAELAYYRPIQSGGLTIALASPNLFAMLQVPIPRGATLILGHADPDLAGRAVRLAGQPAAVAAVLPADSWRLPGRPDAWLLVDEQRLDAISPDSKGFVLARLRNPDTGRWHVSVPNDRGMSDAFSCTSLATGLPILAVLLVIAMACLILPVTTSLSTGECSAAGPRRWIFLALKIALVMPIVFFGTLDLAPILVAGEIHAQTMLFGYVLAFRWILIDQRRRCPVCLRLLSHPTRIGGASHVFLAWYGTEFMCARGHGLMHVPEIPTSSYASQRWLPLDPSWSSLFP